jgi:thioredoxin reductase (NADPH)
MNTQKTNRKLASPTAPKGAAAQPDAQVKMPTGQKVHDVLIVGGGPAALTAAIYTSRDDLETLVFEKGAIGGIPATTDWIENYPGFPEGVSGLDFCNNISRQAEKFGAEIILGEVSALKRVDSGIKLVTSEGDFYAKAVLLAIGTDNKKLNIPGEREYSGRGVHYCATCDGAFYRDKKVVVSGGGNSALQEALFLTRFASHIDLLVRSTIRADDVLVHKVGNNDKITVHLHTTTDKIIGDGKFVKKVIGTNVKTGQPVEFETDGLFVFVGKSPNTVFLQGTGIKFDEVGYIQTDSRLQTSLKGVFAAGDARCGATMQIACAAGEGAAAALNIREYLHHTPDLGYKNIED